MAEVFGYGEGTLSSLSNGAEKDFNDAEDKLKLLGGVKSHNVAGDGGGQGDRASDLGSMQKTMMEFNVLMSKGEVKKGGHKQGSEQIKGVGQKMGQ